MGNSLIELILMLPNMTIRVMAIQVKILKVIYMAAPPSYVHIRQKEQGGTRK